MDDYADNLYKVQCAKWAYKRCIYVPTWVFQMPENGMLILVLPNSVKEGVQHFKSGNTVEAFQCLNKALQMDAQNVEALVARGAL